MAAQPRLVNKQFNSPIGLYSAQNVQEVLERETQILANGAVGINFHNPDVGKPGNLKNSAVLRMLEEEENRQRNGFGPGDDHIARPLRENITWPPPAYEHKNQLRSTFKDVVTTGAKRVAWPPPNESGFDSPHSEQSSVTAKGGPQYPSQSPSGFQQNSYQAPQHQSVTPNTAPVRSPLKPLDVTQRGVSPLASPLSNQSPQGFRPATPSRGWAPVHSPVGTPAQPSWQQSSSTHYQTAHQSVNQQTYLGQQYQTTPQHYQPPQNQYQPPQNQYQPPQNQYQPPQNQYQPPQNQYQPPQNQYQPPQNQYQPPQNQYQPPQNQYQPQQQYQPPQNQYQPQQQYQAPPQNQYAPQQQYQAPPQQYQAPPQQYQAPPQQYQAPPNQYQTQQSAPSQFSPKPAAAPTQVAPKLQSKPVEPPPSLITLRPKAPVSQASPPVVTSQPATATLRVKVSRKHLRGDQKWPPEDVRKKMIEEAENVDTSNSFLSIQGGKHLRGDLKWPPENVKKQSEEENRLRLELARGPVCRPRRPNKDYTEFFSQHALNSTYPGYKIPPGTQFYREV